MYKSEQSIKQNKPFSTFFLPKANFLSQLSGHQVYQTLVQVALSTMVYFVKFRIFVFDLRNLQE